MDLRPIPIGTDAGLAPLRRIAWTALPSIFAASMVASRDRKRLSTWCHASFSVGPI